MKKNLTLAVFLLIGSAISMAANDTPENVQAKSSNRKKALSETELAVYSDEYTPLYSSQMVTNLTSWVTNNSFDDATKIITFDHTTFGGKVGWQYSTAKDFTKYTHIIMAFNPQANSAGEIHLSTNESGKEYVLCADAAGAIKYVENGTSYIDVNMKTDYFKADNVSTLTFDKVDWFAFWDGPASEYQMSLANVFLTNTLPDWNNPEARKTTSGNYGTVCLEYPAICTSGYVYQIKSINSAKTKIGIEPYNGVMRAGVPYIYKSIGDGVNFYEIKDNRVHASEGGSNNGLIGCLNETSLTKNSNLYVLHNNMWYLVDSENFSSAANRAYIDISKITPADDNTLAKGMTMDLSEEITGVNTIKVSNSGEEEATYTITGVKLGKDATLQRGIYIRGGKKFVVK